MDAALRKFRAHRQVEVVFTKNELIAAAAPTGPVDEWTLLERAKASFDPERSGDLVVLLKPFVSIYPTPQDPEREYVTTHGSPGATIVAYRSCSGGRVLPGSNNPRQSRRSILHPRWRV